MTFKIIEGDLFDASHNFTAIGQGVNCRGIMGAGIAVPFKNNYPDMYEKYVKLCSRNPYLLPGTVQIHLVDVTDDRPDVINLFTQFAPGRNASFEYLEKSLHAMDTQLDLINDVFREMTNLEPSPWSVGLPLIAGGIGGLERHNIIHFMEIILGPSIHDYTLVERP